MSIAETFVDEFPLADNEAISHLIALDKGSKPVEHFFRNPKQTSYTISPDGTYLAFLAPYEDRLNLFVRNLETSQERRLTSRTDRDIPGYFWGDDEHLVYVQDNGGDENYHVYVTRRDGTSERDMTPFDGVKADIIDSLRDIPGQIIIGLNKDNSQLFDPYRLDLRTGELTKLASNADPMNPVSYWITDHQGKIRAAVRMTDGVNTTLVYRDTEAGEFRELTTTDFRESLRPLCFTFDNQQLYVSTNLGRDKSVIARWDPATQTEVEVLYENDTYDVDGLQFSRKRKVLTTISYESWKQEKVYLDDEARAIYTYLEQQLPGYEVALVSVSRNEDKYIVRTYSDRSLGAFYLYNRTINELSKLAEVNNDLKEDELSEMRSVTYTTRDGLTVQAYLTLPKGKDPQNLPLVVNPHGGPWVRDSWGFNPEVQLLANRGYAVFQPNYRGSVGFGRKYWEVAFKQWGGTMQNDITDGVQWLIAEGIANPRKVAIYGGSYGGYATLAGVAFTPDLYCCAVDYVGVSNLFTFLETIPPYWKPYLDMMYEMVGHPEKDKEAMIAASPVFHVDEIKTPLFIVQGAKDPRVNIDESDQMVKALRDRGVEVPYMVKANEGHGFRNQENKFEFYKAMYGFLSQYLG